MRHYPTPAIFRISPSQERIGMFVSFAVIVTLAYVSWSIQSVQLSALAVVPLGVFAWFSCSRATYWLAVAQAVSFTYFDYAGPQAALVNLPVDAALTLLSYLAVVAFMLAARRAIADSVSLREQLAITAENASIQSWLADHDALTSAANRRAFKRAVMHAAASASLSQAPFGIIVGDIDNFKAINTRYGHAAGDRLLCTLFSRAQLASDGMLVGRLDGDQFGALLTGVSSDFELFVMADKLLRDLALPYVINEHGIRITVTFATAMFPADAKDADALLEIAERKLYEAKRR
jgi:diguanylate cyclase (GGDEF)-like protein